MFPFPEGSAKPWTPVEVAEVLNRLGFVTWDRLVAAPVVSGDVEHRTLSVYGWIDRPDAHHDFVIVTFVSWDDKVGYSTSSAARSREIGRILAGEDKPHNDCVPVADVLGPLVPRTVVRRDALVAESPYANDGGIGLSVLGELYDGRDLLIARWPDNYAYVWVDGREHLDDPLLRAALLDRVRAVRAASEGHA